MELTEKAKTTLIKIEEQLKALSAEEQHQLIEALKRELPIAGEHTREKENSPAVTVELSEAQRKKNEASFHALFGAFRGKIRVKEGFDEPIDDLFECLEEE